MIYVKYQGASRLGNWLWQYAVARSADRDVVWYVPDDVGAGHFDSLKAIVGELPIVTEIPGNCVRFGERVAGSTTGLPAERPLLLDGYFQNAALLDKTLVKRIFHCPNAVEARLRQRYPEVFDGRETVGGSVRRGDYLSYPHRFPFVGTTYLKRAVARFSEEALFVVCSDDIPWCRTFFNGKRFGGRRFLFVEGEGVLEQLYVHTFCRHNVIGNSSFSWWGGAGYICGNFSKRVVFPSRWFGPGEKADAAGLYYPGVEVVACAPRPTMYFWMVFYPVKRFLGDVLRAVGLR